MHFHWFPPVSLGFCGSMMDLSLYSGLTAALLPSVVLTPKLGLQYLILLLQADIVVNFKSMWKYTLVGWSNNWWDILFLMAWQIRTACGHHSTCHLQYMVLRTFSVGYDLFRLCCWTEFPVHARLSAHTPKWIDLDSGCNEFHLYCSLCT